MNKYRGFSLIELLVIITVIVLFLGFGMSKYNTYSQQVKLKNDAKKLVDVLELTKKKALSADLLITPGTPNTFCSNFTGYKVSIAASSYSLNYCCSSTCSLVQNYDLSDNITVISGLGDYTFPPLMNNPNFISTTIRLRNSTISMCLDISISPIGIIELNETLITC